MPSPVKPQSPPQSRWCSHLLALQPPYACRFLLLDSTLLSQAPEPPALVMAPPACALPPTPSAACCSASPGQRRADGRFPAFLGPAGMHSAHLTWWKDRCPPDCFVVQSSGQCLTELSARQAQHLACSCWLSLLLCTTQHRGPAELLGACLLQSTGMPGATGLQGYHSAPHRCCIADKSRHRNRPARDVYPIFNLPHTKLTLDAADLLGSSIKLLLQLLLLFQRIAVIIGCFLAEGLQAGGSAAAQQI